VLVLFGGASFVSTRCCCQVASRSSVHGRTGTRVLRGGPPAPWLARLCVDFAGWIVPGGMLALLPKCPVCLAAYVAIGTGVGLSVSTATYLRMLLVILCIGWLLYLSAKSIRRIFEQLSSRRVEKSVSRSSSASGSGHSLRESQLDHQVAPECGTDDAIRMRYRGG
jgi:hypothetical protein